MKAANLIKVTAVMLVLCTAAVGCKHKPQNPTPLPGYGLAPGEEPSGVKAGNPRGLPVRPLPEPAPPVSTTPPVTMTEGGLAPTDDDKSILASWDRDYNAFGEQTVYFDFDKSVVKSSELPKLQIVADKVKAMGANNRLLVEGHCDERGTEEYNRALGERRALAVREQLAKMGLDPAKVLTLSYGEDRPAVPGHNEAAWSKNRRGQLVLLTKPAGPVTGGTPPANP